MQNVFDVSIDDLCYSQAFTELESGLQPQAEGGLVFRRVSLNNKKIAVELSNII